MRLKNSQQYKKKHLLFKLYCKMKLTEVVYEEYYWKGVCTAQHSIATLKS